MNKTSNPVALVLRWAGRNRKYLVASIVCATLSGLMVAVPYFAVFDMMRAVYEGRCTPRVVAVDAAVLVAGTLLRHILFGVSNALAHKGAYGALLDVRCSVLDRLSKAPLGELDDRSTGRIKTVLSDDVEKLELLLAHNLPEAFMYVSGPAAAFVFLLTANAPLALVTLVPAIAAFAVLVRLFKIARAIMPRAMKSLEDMNSVMVEYVSGMRVIKALDMGARSFRRFRAAVDEEHEVWGEMSRRTGPGFAAYVVVIEAGLLLMVPLGALMLTHGAVDGSTYLLFAFAGSLYLTEIRLLQDFSNKLSQASAGAQRVQELLDVPAFGAGQAFPEDASIRFDGVSFAYGDDAPEVLHDVSLTVGAGERLALVGPSGSGKSTLVELVGRFYDVTSGAVTIGGRDVRDIDYDDLLAHVSVVFQKTFLTSGTIAENIRMGSDATLEEVRAAARLAQADAFIAALPDGYDTVIGTLGARLSGGERQRIAIARAILKDAPILVLDEATSSADPENQAFIDEAIASLCEGKTVLIVAHRLDVVPGCDRVAVIEDGSLTAVGTHDELLASSPYYRTVWEDYNQSRSMNYRVGAADSDAMDARGKREALAEAAPKAASTTATSADAAPAEAAPFAKGRDFYVSCACTVVEGMLGGFNFVLVYLVIQQVFSDSVSLAALFGVTGALVGVFALRLAVYSFGYVRGQIGGSRISRNLRVALGDSIKRIPLSRFTERSSGEYLQALTVNVNDYEQILTHRTGDILKNVSLASVITVFVAFLYAPAGAVVLLSFLLLVPAVALSWRQVKVHGPHKDEVRASNSSAIMEHVDGMQALRAYGMAGVRNDAIVDSMREFSRVSYVYERAVIPVGVALAILAGLSQPLLVVLCYQAWKADAVAASSFLLISMMPLLTLRLVNGIFIDLTAYRNLRIARNNVAAVLAEPQEEGSFDAVPMEGAAISLSHVDFSYGRGPRVLSDFSLRVPEGRLTALVGESGCGKSTVLSLIAQLYRSDRGTIAFGGADTAAYAPESVLRNVALVDQDVFLFDDSVMDNVRYARPGASDEEVREACRLANADGFVSALPEGYATRIGENGGFLSGGERQRISIARAILRDAPIVLLDEATSNLDVENELAVRKAVANLLSSRKTVVMVAHTLSVIRKADSIAVIDGGAVAEQGTHEELLARGGKYARMWSASRP